MKKTRLRALPWLLIVPVLLVVALLGFVIGKYVTTIESNNTVTFTATLAADVRLQESKVTRNEDGSYKTTDETITSGTQEYILIPGLDVPKDPHIVITGKTEIPAYLFIEVVDTTPNAALRYNLTDTWIKTTLRTPKVTGATLYVYSKDGTSPTSIIEDHDKISILQDDTFYVDQSLKDGDSSNSLTFYAYLEEASVYSTP